MKARLIDSTRGASNNFLLIGDPNLFINIRMINKLKVKKIILKTYFLRKLRLRNLVH